MVMLLQKRNEVFDDKDYLFEPKMDGIRLILTKSNNKTKLYTRHNNETTAKFPELCSVPIDGDVVLDGELISIDPHTQKINFERVMERFMSNSKPNISVQYVVFDILSYKGKDLRKKTLVERKRILNEVLADNDTFVKIKYVEDQGIALFEAAKKMDLEGTVAKVKNSVYESDKRSWSWIKHINWKYENVFVTGYRKGDFGWLVANPHLKPMGILELGTTPEVRKAFYGVSKKLKVNEDKKFVYIEPKIQIKTKFRNYTKNGYLRTPSFCEFVL